MRPLLRFVARLYPASWRRRYGREFDALLEQIAPTLRDVFDVAKGGIVTRIRSAAPAVMAIVLSVAGGITAGVIAKLTSDRVESKMTLTFQRAGAATADARGDDGAVLDVAARALDDGFMASLGNGAEVRSNTQISVTQPAILHLSYTSNSPSRSQMVVREIASRILAGALSARESGSFVPGTLRVLSGPVTGGSAPAVHILTASALGIGLGLLCALIGTRMISVSEQ